VYGMYGSRVGIGGIEVGVELVFEITDFFNFTIFLSKIFNKICCNIQHFLF
jgi:hypothetical protein